MRTIEEKSIAALTFYMEDLLQEVCFFFSSLTVSMVMTKSNCILKMVSLLLSKKEESLKKILLSCHTNKKLLCKNIK